MSFSLLQPLRDLPFAFVDVETTGASADFGHKVIEIGISRVENGRVVTEYEHLLDPQRPISKGVTALTGITQAMVSVFEKLLDPIGGWTLPLCDALVAQGGNMGLLPVNPRERLLPLELEEALEMRKPVMMEYLDGVEARTQRVIEPRTIRRRGGE